MRRELDRTGAPSIAVAVAQNGRIVWQDAIGFADRENRIRATPDTPYPVASVTKSSTAAALLLLEKRHQINLDQPVNDYLWPAKLTSPWWDPRTATVRDVMQHRAGLTTFFNSCRKDCRHRIEICRFPINETIRRYGTIFWKPETKFDYSNLGYGLLGEVISRTGRSDYVRREIFRAWGMTHSDIGPLRYAALRYPKGADCGRWYEEATPYASSQYSSVHDLALFGIHAPIEAMAANTVEADDGYRYGLGVWVKENDHGYRTVLAQGGAAGDSAAILIVPSEHLVVAVATNGDGIPTVDVAHEIAAILLPRFAEKTPEAPSGPEAVASLPITGNWSGGIRTYRGDVPLELSVKGPREIEARLGTAAPVAMHITAIHKGHFHATMPGDLALHDAPSGSYDLELILEPHDDTMTGAVTTQSHPGVDPAAALSFPVTLKERNR